MVSSTCEHSAVIQIGNRSYDVSEIQRLVPQLEEAIARRDRVTRELENTLQQQTEKIKSLEKDVETLQAECDKLRSVLNQKTQIFIPPTPKSSDEIDLSSNTESVNKKVAVSAEPAHLPLSDEKLPKYDKSAGAKKIIREAIARNDFLKRLPKEKVHKMIECMYKLRARPGEWVIREGEPGDKLYVIVAGELEVSRQGAVLRTIGPCTVMGELAILYDCARTASIQAKTEVDLFVLRREDFKFINTALGNQMHDDLLRLLKGVPLFAELPIERISRLADVVDKEYFPPNEYIIRQGEMADTFYLLTSGQVKITQQITGEKSPREIRILSQGDFFGEKALFGNEARTASVIAMEPGVEVLSLDRNNFLKLIGDLDALKKDYGDAERSKQPMIVEPSANKVPEKEFANLQLDQLQRIATLGVGGFGRVELVCVDGDRNRTFALKALKKKHIVDTKQQEHIFSEKNIMIQLRSDWIVRLYTTFRDTRYVYMLLEVCLGGELWTTLRDRGHFDDYTSRFYVACVLEALEYLHRRSIVYRDLKPENCILNNKGYLKLVDFGFAKKLVAGRKTWTFCGTPEYVSPEVILNKGHDHAVDYWALGIYICELLLGRPPFQAGDPMKTYTLILRGIDALDIPNRRIGKTATSLVKRLCRDNPGERLGTSIGGVSDIRKHRWFMGFDWEALRARAMEAPIVPKVTNPSDSRNFDNYSEDLDEAPEELSGWDQGF
ncbi:unnamed protein product [Enterobius vermicularis]|uniref:cGMP-dependent protein kinase n=1 Tax=Enterobius vermicularis TaxID=51028 RepID=A0A0N4VIU2_ENTVE|nr:unnamed protein product [Enterobius vermicularis]